MLEMLYDLSTPEELEIAEMFRNTNRMQKDLLLKEVENNG